MPKPKKIDHLKTAAENLKIPHGLTYQQYAARTAAALAHATIELAEQQKTANLIAYTTAAYEGGLAYPPGEGVLKSVQADIEERLGLA